MNYVRLIFERGVEISAAANSIKQPEGCLSVTAITAEVFRTLKLRPVLLTNRINWGVNPSEPIDNDSLLSSSNGNVLDLVLSALTQIPDTQGRVPLRLLQKTFNVEYIVGAVIYH